MDILPKLTRLLRLDSIRISRDPKKATPGTPATPVRPPVCPPASAEVTKPLTVVIADDDRRILDLITLSLKGLGHHVLASAGNGRIALELVRMRRPDLVILDVDMPEMDGIDVARQILADRSVPIIISTGRVDDDTLSRVQQVNVQAYLVKPFSKLQLKSAIVIALAQHQQLIARQVKIATLTHELEQVKALDLAVAMLMEKFHINRKEAMERLEVATRARPTSASEVARCIVSILDPARPAEAAPAPPPASSSSSVALGIAAHYAPAR